MLQIIAPLTLAQLDQPTAEDLARLKESLKAMQAELLERQGARSEIEQKLQRAETEMASLHDEIDLTLKDIAGGEERLISLGQEQTRLESQLKQQQATFDQHLRSAYLMSRESRLKLLFEQDNPQRLARRLAYYDYFGRANRDRLDAYLVDIRNLTTVQQALASENLSLEASRLKLAARSQALDTLQMSRRETLVRLNTEIGSSRQRIEEMDREREELEALLDSMTEALAGLELRSEVEDFAKARGNMPWPANGRLRNHFGARRGQGGLRWQGLMIGADEGQDVHAIHHGRVVYADWLRGSGLLVIIDHGDGYMSLYAHNQLLLRETGEWVATGDTLARVGATGGRQQAGLYFEIRHRGAPLDPVSWCRRRT